MIHYHGGPIWPVNAAIKMWKGRHGFVSFFRPDQIDVAAEQCQTFAADNGAYSFWKSGQGEIDVPAYAAFVQRWSKHPGFDWCLIPDVIDGSESINDQRIIEWGFASGIRRELSVPVWHLHETIDRLVGLANAYPRVAIGSSGQFAKLRTAAWDRRMDDAFAAICDPEGFPITKLHGLRMLDGDILKRYPFASADSSNVARNIILDKAWKGPYAPKSKATRAVILADNLEHDAVAHRWVPTAGLQHDLAGFHHG